MSVAEIWTIEKPEKIKIEALRGGAVGGYLVLFPGTHELVGILRNYKFKTISNINLHKEFVQNFLTNSSKE